MAITNSVRRVLPGFGIPNIINATGTQATAGTTMTATAAFSPTTQYASYGMVRVKVSGIDATHAITSFLVTATDGTTIIDLLRITTFTGVNAQGAEITQDFCSDLKLNSFSAVIGMSVGVTAATVDVEVFGAPAV